MKRLTNRRAFLKTAAGLGTGLVLLSDSRLLRGSQAAEKLNVALVGVGGRGTWFVDTIPAMENVVAICDVDDRKIADAFRRWEERARQDAGSKNRFEQAKAARFAALVQSKPKVYHDFREMLDKSGGGIDAVIVATPDHSHAVISAAAIRAGKHVYCEKPLTRTVAESRALRELARKQKVATSMGNQGTASGQFRRALELIQDGTIGEIRDVQVWNDGGGADRKQPPQGVEPVPEYLKWDLWLGPAAVRPYNHEWLRRNMWREFGTCQLGNWATHTANLAFMSLKVDQLWLDPAAQPGGPTIGVEAETSDINRLSFPRWEVIRWSIPARAGLPPITFTWHNGPGPGAREMIQKIMKEAVGLGERQRKGLQWSGAMIVGTKGRIVTTGHNANFCLLPDDRFRDVKKDRPLRLDASRGHEADWFAACRGGKPAWANFDYASALTEFLMLGNVATQFRAKLDFDPPAMKIVNNADADAQVHYRYRKGWTL